MVYSQKNVIENLRQERQKLEDTIKTVRQAFIKYFGEDLIEDEAFKAGDYDACDSINLANAIRKILEAEG